MGGILKSLKEVQPKIYASLVILALFLYLDLVTASAGEKLVAPAYPGSVRLTPLQIKENHLNVGSENAVFVTKDSHEKVQAFYVPKYARLPSKDENYPAGKTHITFIVHSYAEVLKSIQKRKGDITKADDTGVYLEWRLEETSKKPLPRYFHELEKEAKKHPGNDAELAELRNKYAWLSRAFFLDKKDDTIFQRCRNESLGRPATTSGPSGKEVDELNKKIQNLYAEGRYKEASDLEKQASGREKKSKRDPGNKQKADNFGLWKKCLEEAAEFAYLTRIVINTEEDLGKY